MLGIQDIADTVAVVAQEFPIKRAELFGSYARGENTSNSDVDLLLEFAAPRVSLLTLSRVQLRLEELLNTKVDVVHAPLPPGSILEIDRRILLYGA